MSTVGGSRDELVGQREVRARLEELTASFRGTYQTVESMAQAFIREAIIRGMYRPGDKLNQDEIATILGVSRIPVRAGLRQLEAEGLVTLEPHRGARVSVLKPAEVQELYTIRGMLEERLLDIAMKKMTPDGLATLRSAAAALDAAVDSAASTWRSNADIEARRSFYRTLYGFAEQPRTLQLVEQLRDEVGRYLLLLRVHHHGSSHVDFVALIEAGDRRAARQWVRAHLTQVSGEIQRLLLAGQHDDAEGRRVRH